MNRLFSRSKSARTTEALDGSCHDQHDVKKLSTTEPLAFAATYDDDDDITDHDDQLAHHHRHHVSSRTGGFEMPRYDDYSDEGVDMANYSEEGVDMARADDDTLQDSSIYTDPYKIVGPRSTDGSNVIIHDSDSAGVCSTATTVQLTPRERHNEKSVPSSPLYTGDIERSIEVYKRALRVQNTTPPRPPSTIATTRVRMQRTLKPATPTVMKVQRNRIPLTPTTSSSSNIFWKQRATPTTPDTATTTTTTDTPTTPLLPSPRNNQSDQSGFWKSPVPVDQPEHESGSPVRKSWSLRGRRAARAERTASIRSSSTAASTTNVCSSPQSEETDLKPNADTHAAAHTLVPCNLSSKFKLAEQMEMEIPMNDDEVIVGVSRSGQGREVEESSHANEQATITTSAATTVATTSTGTTGSSSSPSSNLYGGSISVLSGGDDVDEGFEVMGFATTPTPTKTTCPPVQEEDDCDEDEDDAYISSSSSASDHSSSSELDLQVNKINVSDTELMRDIQNPGVLRLTAEGLQSHEYQSFQKAVHMHGRGGSRNGNGNDNNTYEEWKRAKLQQKWHREKHNERQEKLTDQNIRLRQQQEQRESTGDSKRQQARSGYPDRQTRKDVAASKKRLVAIKKDDVEEFSLAPLNMMENLDLKIDADEVSSTKSKKSGIFGFFRSKSSHVSATVSDLLQKEREAAAEAHTQKKIREHRDRQRIESNRQAYLESARNLESDMTPIHIRVFSKPLPGLLGDGDWI
jgi:hypothetical protein